MVFSSVSEFTLRLNFALKRRLTLISRFPLHHCVQGPGLDHQRHNLEQRVRGSHGRKFRVGIVRRGNFDNVRSNEVDAFEATNDGAEFPRRPTARLGGAGCGSDFGEAGQQLRYTSSGLLPNAKQKR